MARKKQDYFIITYYTIFPAPHVPDGNTDERTEMLTDRYGRKIEYLRISVTDRCNYRCVYCMPESGVKLKDHSEILSFEAIAKIAEVAGGLGFTKVRLTGGEPLVRRNIDSLVGMIGRQGLFREITMTTNGVLLSLHMAAALKDAGLTRINISLDTLDPGKFRSLTRGGDIGDVLSGIEAAKAARLDPVKINMIIFDDTTGGEIDSMRSFCDAKGLVLQTIKHFSLYQRENGAVVSSFDRPMPCEKCDKVRLTADGYLKPCLFTEKEIRVDMDDIEKSIREAIEAKVEEGSSCCNRSMYQIGG